MSANRTPQRADGYVTPAPAPLVARQVASTTFFVGNESFGSDITFTIDSITKDQTAETTEVVLSVTNTVVNGTGFIPTLDLSATVNGATQSTGEFFLDPGTTETFTLTFATVGTVSATATRTDTGETFTIGEGGGFSREQLLLIGAIVLLVAAGILLRRR